MFFTFFKCISNSSFLTQTLPLRSINFRKKLLQLFSNNIVESSTRYIINLNIV